jgi:hypothetical protein
MAQGFELGPQTLIVVYFPVIDNSYTPVFTEDRLHARCKVDNG